ncbi:cytochrome B, partial [Holdemania filiformis]|uniref:cytochrome B n=1 Tax=Holdemania filiformis TaxID=61171 RepID=UPI002674899F
MSVKQIARIAIMAAMMAVVFTMFSQVLYLEAITLTIAVLALTFERREVFYGALVFTLVNMLVQGVSIWTFAYCLIYPVYALLFGSLKPVLRRHRWAAVALVGLCSFATGQLLDLPFILFSPKVTLIYIVLGLKTSVIQGLVSALEALFLLDPLLDRLEKI